MVILYDDRINGGVYHTLDEIKRFCNNNGGDIDINQEKMKYEDSNMDIKLGISTLSNYTSGLYHL